MLRKLIALALLAALAGAAGADEPPAAPAFDYWVLALTWNPQYCIDHPREIECAHAYGFVVHGLWPQNEQGSMEDCDTSSGRVDKALVERMLPLMPSAALIQHEWYEHGSCSGMDASKYFLSIERLHRALVVPGVYSEVGKPLKTTLDELKAEFGQSNPSITPEKMVGVCSGRYLKEVRICYDRDFKSRECGERVRDKCGDSVVLRSTR